MSVNNQPVLPADDPGDVAFELDSIGQEIRETAKFAWSQGVVARKLKIQEHIRALQRLADD